MSEKVEQIINELKILTLVEAAELVKKIEKTFDVDASTVTNNSMVMGNTSIIEEIEEKTEFTLILDKVPLEKKIPILKIVRSLTSLGLKEAKELVESAPKTIQEGLSKNNAEDAKKQLEAVGAEVSIT